MLTIICQHFCEDNFLFDDDAFNHVYLLGIEGPHTKEELAVGARYKMKVSLTFDDSFLATLG